MHSLVRSGTLRTMKTIEVVMHTTQRIREVFFAYVEDDDPLTKMTPASLDPDAVFADSRFKLVETEHLAHLHIDVEAVDVSEYTLQDQVEERR